VSSRLPILNVACNKRNGDLLAQFLGNQGYNSVSVTTIADFESSLHSVIGFGLAIVDISGFDRRIWNACDKLSQIHVPLMVVMPMQAQHARHEGFLHGAQRVMVKPLIMKELIESISMVALENQHE